MAKGSDLRNKDSGQFHLRDYAHASKTFLSEPGYVMLPKTGFNFFTRIVFNSVGESQNGSTSKTISVLVKKVDLPKFNLETETFNKYNQKEIVHTKLNYEPINMILHDDMKNTIRNMWLAYNDYYFADRGVTPQAWARNDTYADTKLFNRFGLDNGQTMRFIKSVDIYSMGNHVYTKYSLINPLLVSLDFDNYDYADATKTMEISARFEYETVLYYQGSTEAIPGFGKDSPYYDNDFSTLGKARMTVRSDQVVENIEQAIAATTKPKIEKPVVDTIRTLPVRISPEQIETVKAVAANSLQTLRRFAFPTANEIKNVSSLVDLTGRRRIIEQGRIAAVGVVTSNGSTVNSAPPSSLGIRSTDANDLPSLLVMPLVPPNLTDAERDAFMQAYPALPSTDARTRMPPYV